MKISSFPDCCGAKVISSFGNTVTALDRKEYTPEDIDKYVKEQIGFYPNQQLLSIINSDQLKVVAPVLKKNGFKRVAANYHSGHGNNIFTFIRIPEPIRESE